MINTNNYFLFIMTEINNFIDIIKSNIANADLTYIKRHKKDGENKLVFNKALYASLMNLKKSGLVPVRNHLEAENICNVTKQALVKNRSNYKTNKHISDLNNEMIKALYDPENKFISPNNLKFNSDNKSFRRNNRNCKIDKSLYINRSNKRFIAIDGTIIHVDVNTATGDIVRIEPHGKYGNLLLLCLYDVVNKIPIAYHPVSRNSNNKAISENAGLIQIIDSSLLNPETDVLIFDRLYYSYELINTLKKKGFECIFRVKSNSIYFNSFKCEHSKTDIVNDVPVRLFKYIIAKEEYCIMTTIMDDISISEIKAMYWLRWKVETDIGKMKEKIMPNRIRSENINSLLTDLACIRFIEILSSYIECDRNRNLDFNFKISSAACIDMIYDQILKLVLFDGKFKARIKELLQIISKNLVQIISGRSFKRCSYWPIKKWGRHGNRYAKSGEG